MPPGWSQPTGYTTFIGLPFSLSRVALRCRKGVLAAVRPRPGRSAGAPRIPARPCFLLRVEVELELVRAGRPPAPIPGKPLLTCTDCCQRWSSLGTVGRCRADFLRT